MGMKQGLIPAQAKMGQERKYLYESNYVNGERRIKEKSGGRVNLWKARL